MLITGDMDRWMSVINTGNRDAPIERRDRFLSIGTTRMLSSISTPMRSVRFVMAIVAPGFPRNVSAANVAANPLARHVGRYENMARRG